MSILSTSAKLVKVGQDYSAGNGISIDNYVISVTSSLTGEYATQSAFDELNDSFSTLSSNLNSNSGIWVDVASTYQTNSSTYLTAHQSLNGYATEQWVEDKGYITGVDLTPYQTKSGMIDYQPKSGMIDYQEKSGMSDYQTTAEMVNYQTTAGMTAYATTSDVANKLDTTAFSNVSGTFLTAHQTIPSAKWETASDVVQSNSAQWSENTGDEEVNNAVYNNSAKWNEISVYESNSSTYLTAHQSLDGYATQDWVTAQGYITGVDLSDYAKTSAVHNDIDSAVSGKLDTTAFSDISGDFLVASSLNGYATESFVENVSGGITALIPTDYVSNETLEQTSGNIVNLIPDTSEFITNASAESTYQPIGNYLSSNALDGYATTAWVQDQGYLTSVNIPESATWNDVSTIVQTNSADWASHQDLSYISAQVDNKLDSTAFNLPESATWNEATTAYQTNSGTYLTAHQDISDLMPKSESANFYPMNDNPSGYLTEHQSLDGYATEDWVTGQGYITGVNLPESATWDDVASTYQTNSGTYLTAHQSLDGYATTSELNSTSSYLSGAIDYVSANAGGSPSGFVSGSNVLFVPNEYTPGRGKVYSATISGDITVSTGNYYNSGEYISLDTTYSLSSVGSQIGNKLNKNVIEDSNTLSLINDKAEVYSFAYKPSEIVTTGITIENYSGPGDVRLIVNVPSPCKLYSASLVIESIGFNYGNIPDGWNFVNSANGSATFTKYYKAENYYDNIVFENFWGYNLTNASAYPVAYIGLVTDELAFKSDLTGQGGGVPQSAFDELKASYDALSASYASLSSLFATYSGQWLLPNTGV